MKAKKRYNIFHNCYEIKLHFNLLSYIEKHKNYNMLYIHNYEYFQQIRKTFQKKCYYSYNGNTYLFEKQIAVL